MGSNHEVHCPAATPLQTLADLEGGAASDGKLHCAIAATGPATPLHCSVFLHRTSLPVRSPSPTNAMATAGSSSSSALLVCVLHTSLSFLPLLDLSSIYGVLSRTERNYPLDLHLNDLKNLTMVSEPVYLGVDLDLGKEEKSRFIFQIG
jgi:hypothetical protein